ncbi:T9SS type A sorting domain-containing protein [Adhaeribacter swui]|uniref:T9SS type A sorting domain-containing protein n=1 Tax=Adhaeribacter swui TaxID=2086471 RepID=A0A7G7G6J7_9BACT|nr:M43 family zinc metalloprotease [Adhaeribacter swui]QNF32781.1 T9SS type A sorting domain-containing protein [Adhaeribacter swui]
MQLRANKFLVFIISFFLINNAALAQQTAPSRRCATNQVTQQLAQRLPGIAAQQQRAKRQAQVFQQQKKLARLQQPVIVVPVVFHVVYRTSRENISTEQILSQLDVLNTDYRRMNADSAKTLPQFKNRAADTRIQFCLATRDPNGQPTTGITRKRTTATSFDLDDAVKFSSYSGQDAWDAERYLNIWVCNLSGETLGYSQYPGGPTETDGVVLDYTTIGQPPVNPFASNYNLGRTGTHEIGHWLGLQHIWGDIDDGSCSDSDDIADTPNQDKASSGCPTGTVVSCNNSLQGGNMYQNFMDYTDDACMNLFTQGQAEYMQSILNTVRQDILTTAVVCAVPLTADFVVSDTIIVAGTTVQFNDASVGVKANQWSWTFEGASTATSSQQNPVVRYDQPGTYTVSLTASFNSVSDAVTKTQYIRVTGTEAIIYPNPAPDKLNIEVPANKELQRIELINSVGQVILTRQATANFITINLPAMANGLYTCRLWYKDGRTDVKKVVIAR